MSLNKKSNSITRFILAVFTVILLAMSCSIFSFAAVTDDATITDSKLTPNNKNLYDNKSSSFSSLDKLSISSKENIDSFYIVFWDNAPSFTLSCGEKSFEIENSFLHAFVKIPEEIIDCNEITITFNEKTNVSEVYAFKEGQLPDWVQVWNAPHEKADLLLNATQYSNEHTLFAGIIPYHIANNYRVQVAFFTECTGSTKKHEMLDGLWAVGMKNYPVLSEFPEVNSKTSEDALKELGKKNITEDMLVEFQTQLIRRFKPQVVVSHDLKGENGNGQYILNTETLIKAVELSKDSSNFNDSAAKYGVWNVPKFYIHLYNENQITLNWDEPLDFYNGKTAFQMSQEGYKANSAQKKTWFTKWLNGNDNKNVSAANIKTYSPCLFGLYHTTVGEDTQMNSFFENIISYNEQERLEQERLEQERLEQERLEQEEKKRQEEESRRLESQRLESLEEESRIAAEKEEALRKQKLQALETKKSEKRTAIIAIIAGIASALLLIVIVFNKVREHMYWG